MEGDRAESRQASQSKYPRLILFVRCTNAHLRPVSNMPKSISRMSDDTNDASDEVMISFS